jgi:4-hydroxyphenylpyruvate dioxygenase
LPTASVTTPRPLSAPQAEDHMPLHGIDHVAMWVGNAAQAAFFYANAFGFRPVAYAGLETGQRDRTSFVLEQGRIRLVLTGALRSDTDVARHHAHHGDGVHSIALSVPDVDRAHAEALARGAVTVALPETLKDELGHVRRSAIAAYGDTIHTFIDRSAYGGAFMPGFEASAAPPAPADEMLLTIDHVVGNVELGRMQEWVAFYERVFGMTELVHFSDEAISTEYSALMSKVVASGDGRIKFPINEPAEGRKRSQIDEYLDFYEGPGAQHIALATRDIVGTVIELRRRGVGFLPIPDSYYDEVPARVPEVEDQLDDLHAQGILVDHDDEGYLLQIFTKPVGDRPTVFFEIIERHGATGFGAGNFKALFEAIEREQERRGNL